MAKKKGKLKKSTPKKDFEKDLDELNHDWEELLAHRQLLTDQKFLHKIAEDIVELNDDATLMEKDPQVEPIAHLVHHMLTTPVGAPFITDKTLLEAAISFDYQKPLRSDLSQIMKNFLKYSRENENAFLTIFSLLHDTLIQE